MGLRLQHRAVRWALLAVATPAAADYVRRSSRASDAPYLINQDRVCTPLVVSAGAATGVPACTKVPADEIAKLSIKEPIVQRGAKAVFAASASGKTLTVTNKSGDPVATWSATDPIGKVVEVYASQYEDRVAVAFTVRALGKDVTQVVAFTLVKTTGTATPTPTPAITTAPTHPTPTAPVAIEDPKVTKAVGDARKAPKAKAIAAWQSVLAIDPAHSESMFRIAALQAGAKQSADALTTLTTLAASSRRDAVEWLVEARFDAAFAALRADPKFRAAVGLDRKPATPYERLMGFGGQWEQTATCGERPEVQFTTQRDRSFKVRIKISCNGSRFDQSYRGTWRLDDAGQVVLALPPAPGQAPSDKDEAPCTFEKTGDEDALHCNLGHDLEFVVLPTRR